MVMGAGQWMMVMVMGEKEVSGSGRKDWYGVDR
jgi:hypothetical protein